MAFAPPGFAGDFTGRTITYIVSTQPGGGYDAYGRLIAKYLEKHLDGATVVVKNVPGAGQLSGAQLIYASPPDGLTIGIFNMGMVYGQMTGMFGDKLDLGKLGWIGKADSEARVVMVRMDSPLKSVEDVHAAKEPLKNAISGKGSGAQFESGLLAKLLGWNLKPIFGFGGTEAEIAVLRGDVDLMIGSRGSLQHYVDAGDARFLLEFGTRRNGDIPSLDEKDFDEQNKPLFALIDSVSRFARATAGPPGMAPELLKVLRDAYAAALADPELLKEAKQANLLIASATGEEVQQAISSVLSQSPAVTAAMKAIVTQE
ncbi:MAG: tripartite tricarboxylate transporter substrate-binding protein [Aestuariivirga sp.]